MILNFAQTIRKMMGWCPCAVTAMTENAMHFDHPVMNETDGGSSTHATIRWKNKYRNLILILAVLISITVINMFISFGASIIDVFLAGLVLGILLDVLIGQVVWNSLDRIPTHVPLKAVRKLSIKRIVVFCIIIFLYVAAFSHFTSIYGWRSVAVFHGGFSLLMWLDYMHIVQWERKNQKTLVKKSWYAPLVAVSDGRDSQ
jgi:Protein of unknown function (DUF1673)